jgi:NhaP-type Na+/H+ and K+/H+ antiporters with a unique C-terminal domain
MIFSLDNIILVGSILLLAAIISTKISRFGIPIVILFIGLGMLAGSDGIGGIYFDNPKVSKFIGGIALCIILFSGGLDTKFSNVKQIFWQGIALSTVGVIITAAIIGLIAHFAIGFSLLEGFLIGSIVSSTDAAAVFSILKTKKLGLKGNLRFILEFESGSNDPMAYFLTILFSSLITLKIGAWNETILLFAQQMVLGSLIGVAMGYAMQRIINWIRLDFEGLYSVLLLALVFFTFSFSEYIGGNSFLAVYIAAVILGNKEFVHKRSLIKHFDGQAWFMQTIMFVTLGLLVFPTKLYPLVKIGLGLSFALIFIARPIAVYLSLLPFKINLRSKAFISLVGLRGSVPIILAIYVKSYNVPVADLIFNLVFFISVTSVLVQGTTFSLVAGWLNVVVPTEVKRKSELDKELVQTPKAVKSEVLVHKGASAIGKRIVDLGIPYGVVITWIKREQKYLLHDGNFIIKENDIIEIIADHEDLATDFRKILGLI